MKIDFNKNVNELFEIGNESNNVTIDDTINVDAIEELIECYNQDYSLHRIKTNLEQDKRLTGDEVDHLMGAIDVLEEMESAPVENKEAAIMVDAPWIGEAAKPMMLANAIFRNYISGVDPIKVDECGSGTIYINKSETEMIEKEITGLKDNDLQKVKQPEVEGKKPRKPRETKTTTTTTGSKSISPQDYIKMLEEKIELTKLLSATIAPEIPEGLTKAGRELMIKFCQDHNRLIVDYLEAIQTL